MASVYRLEAGGQKGVPHCVQRDHQECGEGIPQESAGDRYESRGCAAGEAHAGQDGGLPHLAASVGKDQERVERGQGAVGGAAHHL